MYCNHRNPYHKYDEVEDTKDKLDKGIWYQHLLHINALKLRPVKENFTVNIFDYWKSSINKAWILFIELASVVLYEVEMFSRINWDPFWPYAAYYAAYFTWLPGRAIILQFQHVHTDVVKSPKVIKLQSAKALQNMIL